MSSRCMSAVFERYPGGGNEFALALALADNAHDDGSHIFPGVATLMHKARQSERDVRRHLAAMLASGWLILVRRGLGRGRPTEYRISPDWLKGAKLAPFLPVDNSGSEAQKGAKTDMERVPNEARKGANGGTTIRRQRTIEETNPLPPKGGADASKQNREPTAAQPIPQTQATPQTERTGNSIAGTGQPVDPGDDGFAAFWRAYPRKVDEGKARKWWAERKPDGPLQALIVQAVRAWCADDEWQRKAGQYIPKPSNWLRWERWRDVPGTQAQSPAPIAYQPVPPREGAPMPPDVRAKVHALLGRPPPTQAQEAACS